VKQDAAAAGACARLCESLRGAEAFANSDGLDAFVAAAMGQNADGKGGLIVALAQALMAELSEFKTAIFEALAAAARWPSLRGRIAGSGVLGVVTATLLAPKQPVAAKALMARLCGLLTVDAVDVTRLGDEKRAKEFETLRGQLVSSGAAKVIVTLARPGSSAASIAAAADTISVMIGYGSDLATRTSLANASAVATLLSHLPGGEKFAVIECKDDEAAENSLELPPPIASDSDEADEADKLVDVLPPKAASSSVEDPRHEGRSDSDDDNDSRDLVAIAAALAAIAGTLADARAEKRAAEDGVEAVVAPLCEPEAVQCLRSILAATSNDHRTIVEALRCLANLSRTGIWPTIDESLNQDLSRLLVLGGEPVVEACGDFITPLLADSSRARQLGDLRPLQRAVSPRIKKAKEGSKIVGLSRSLQAVPTCDHCGSASAQALSVCGGCREVSYCSRDCQKAAWPTHKASCNKGKKK